MFGLMKKIRQPAVLVLAGSGLVFLAVDTDLPGGSAAYQPAQPWDVHLGLIAVGLLVILAGAGGELLARRTGRPRPAPSEEAVLQLSAALVILAMSGALAVCVWEMRYLAWSVPAPTGWQTAIAVLLGVV
jgi:hypothetical protein